MKVTQNDVERVLLNSKFETKSFYGKSVIVSCKLPNGFVIEGAGSCVDPDEFDEEIGISVAMNKIKDKIWELLGYELQIKLYGALSF